MVWPSEVTTRTSAADSRSASRSAYSAAMDRSAPRNRSIEAATARPSNSKLDRLASAILVTNRAAREWIIVPTCGTQGNGREGYGDEAAAQAQRQLYRRRGGSGRPREAGRTPSLLQRRQLAIRGRGRSAAREGGEFDRARRLGVGRRVGGHWPGLGSESAGRSRARARRQGAGAGASAGR